MEKHYVITWNGVMGKVLANSEIFFDIDKKPQLDFPFHQLFFDTSQNIAYLTTGASSDSPVADLTIELNTSQVYLFFALHHFQLTAQYRGAYGNSTPDWGSMGH